MSIHRNYLAKCAAILNFVFLSGSAIAAPPTSHDVDVYSSLCKIGTRTSIELSGELAAISRRVNSGEGKLSTSTLQNDYPDLRDNKSNLNLLQSFQDCMYRYVERFHAAAPSSVSGVGTIVDPSVPPERRREIVHLASELDSFKQKMKKVIVNLPAMFYDKKDSTEKKPKEDPRLIGLAEYDRYRAFESASGGLDFSNATNSDLVILCKTYVDEINAYKDFIRQYQALSLPPYAANEEVKRICSAASRGR